MPTEAHSSRSRPFPLSTSTNTNGISSSADKSHSMGLNTSGKSPTTTSMRLQLQTLLDDKEKQLQLTGTLGQRFLQQQMELEERINQLSEYENANVTKGGKGVTGGDEETNTEMRTKLQELAETMQRWETENEQLWSGLASKPIPSAPPSARPLQTPITPGSSPRSAHRDLRPPSPALQPPPALEFGETNPSVPNGPSAAQSSRRAKNAAHRANDVEFAFEIGSSLLTEVRRLQALLSERDKTVHDLKEERDDLDKTVESLRLSLRQQEASADKFKEENWNLEVISQELRNQLSDAQGAATRAETELKRKNAQLASAKEHAELQKSESEKHVTLMEELKAKHETDVAQMRRQAAALTREKSDLQTTLDTLKTDLAKKERLIKGYGSPLAPTSKENGEVSTPMGPERDDEFFTGITSTRRKEPGSAFLTPAAAGESWRNDFDSSPEGSPIKPSIVLGPSHPSNELEALKQSLAHAHRQINTLKGTIQREKEQKLEFKRRLAKEGLLASSSGIPGAWNEDDDEEDEEDEIVDIDVKPKPVIKARSTPSRLRGTPRRGRGGRQMSLAQKLGIAAAERELAEEDEDEDDTPSTSTAAQTLLAEHAEEESPFIVSESAPSSRPTSVDGMDPAFANVLRGLAKPTNDPRSSLHGSSPLKPMSAPPPAPSSIGRKSRGGAGFQDGARPPSLIGPSSAPSALSAELGELHQASMDSSTSGLLLEELELERPQMKEMAIQSDPEPVREPIIKEVIVEVPVEKIVERIVEVPVEKIVEKIVEVEKVVEVPVEKIVEVPVEKIVEKIVEVEKPVERIVEVVVEKVVEKRVEVPTTVHRNVEVPTEKVVERIVEVPVDRIVEKIVEVPVEVEKIVERRVEVPVEVEKIVERTVEVPVERIVEVPVERIVEKVIEVPVEKIVEKIVEVPVEKVVEKIVERLVEVPAPTAPQPPPKEYSTIDIQTDPTDEPRDVEIQTTPMLNVEIQSMTIDREELEIPISSVPPSALSLIEFPITITDDGDRTLPISRTPRPKPVAARRSPRPVGMVFDSDDEHQPETETETEAEYIDAPETPGPGRTPTPSHSLTDFHSAADSMHTAQSDMGDVDSDADSIETSRDAMGQSYTGLPPHRRISQMSSLTSRPYPNFRGQSIFDPPLLPPKPEVKDTGVQTEPWMPPPPPPPAPVSVPGTPVFHRVGTTSTASAPPFAFISSGTKDTTPFRSNSTSTPSNGRPISPIANTKSLFRDSSATFGAAKPRAHSVTRDSRRPSIESAFLNPSSSSSVLDDKQLSPTRGVAIPQVVDKSRPPVMMLPPPPPMPPPPTIPAKKSAAPPRPTSPPPIELIQRATTPTFGRSATPTSSLMVPAAGRSYLRQHGSVPPSSVSDPHNLRQPSSTNSFRAAAGGSSQFGGSGQKSPIGSSFGDHHTGLLNGKRQDNISSATSLVYSGGSSRPPSRRPSVSSSHSSEIHALASTLRTPGRTSISGARSDAVATPHRHGGEDGGSTDPDVIHSITQTMIGEYLYKYQRRVVGRGYGEKRHRRFFWVHPYTKTLYWSSADPGSSQVSESTSKSAYVESVKSVLDPNPMPPGMYQYSIVVSTPQREIKFSCPTKERHDIWYSALNYLLARPTTAHYGSPSGNEENVEPPQSPLDHRKYSTERGRQHNDILASPRSTRSIRSFQAYSTTPRAMRSNTQLSHHGSLGKRPGTPAAEYLRWMDDSQSPTRNQRARHDEPHGDHEEYDNVDPAEGSFELAEDEPFEGLENVRACCDGEHDIGTLSRKHNLHHHHHHHHHHPLQHVPQENLAPPVRPTSPSGWSLRSMAHSTKSEGGGIFGWGDGKRSLRFKRGKSPAPSKPPSAPRSNQ